MCNTTGNISNNILSRRWSFTLCRSSKKTVNYIRSSWSSILSVRHLLTSVLQLFKRIFSIYLFEDKKLQCLLKRSRCNISSREKSHHIIRVYGAKTCNVELCNNNCCFPYWYKFKLVWRLLDKLTLPVVRCWPSIIALQQFIEHFQRILSLSTSCVISEIFSHYDLSNWKANNSVKNTMNFNLPAFNLFCFCHQKHYEEKNPGHSHRHSCA